MIAQRITGPVLLATACFVGALSVYAPRASLLVAATLVVAAVATERGQGIWRDLAFLTLGGAIVLDYGFANVGLTAAVPIPLADAVLVVLVCVGAVSLSTTWPSAVPFLLAITFMIMGAARLILDAGEWGTAAYRDVTLPVETGWLFVGYWVARHSSVEALTRRFSWLFVITLAYVWAYPWRADLQQLGPMVGLQNPVPLLGNYWGASTAAAIGLLFFLVMRPFGRTSYVLAAAFIPPLVMVQNRGIYLAIAAALISLAVAGRHRLRGFGTRLVAVAALAAAGLTMLFLVQPQGRLGPVSVEYTVAHLRTLTGAAGPSAGTIAHRRQWLGEVWRRVSEEPETLLFGVGLGPDLAGGFVADDGVAVRKPHNDYLEVLARFGLVGLGVFVAFLATGCYQAIRSRAAESARSRLFRYWVFSAVIVLLVIAATQPLLQYPYGTMPLFVLLGAGIATRGTGPQHT